MKNEYPTAPESSNRNLRKHKNKAVGLSLVSGSVLLSMAVLSPMSAAFAAEPKVGLGTTDSYSVLGGQTVTNTGNSVLAQDLGVSPGTAITGFPPGITLGTTHAADAEAAQAQSDLVIAYDDAAGRAPTASVADDLVGQTLVGGVYKSTGPLAVSGTLTLDAQNDPNTVFVFQVASTLTTASASNINLINGAQACNVYWQVGSSATLGTASTFKGSILALTSITVTTDTTVEGRALARNGQVSLDNNTFTAPGCLTSIPTTPPVTPVPTTPPATPVPTTPPATTPPAVTPPATTPPAVVPPAVTPPATTPPATTPPATTPPAVVPPVLTPPALTPPAVVPPVLTPPATTPPATTPPATTPPTTDTSEDLAPTGIPVNMFLAFGGVLMLMLGAATAFIQRKTRYAGKH